MKDAVRLSVCIATYHGEAHVLEQMGSILEQLGPSDEVVVVDDGSRDSTPELLRTLADRRVRIQVLERNVGHVRAFETALGLARGEVIMLSDQDDLWAPGRVDLMLAGLSGADLVVGAYETFGDTGGGDSSSRLGSPGSTSVGNLAGLALGRRAYSGCVMAFRRDLLTRLLPFPSYIEAHDHWLGVVGNVGARTRHLPVVVTYRRIHDHNVTSRTRRSFVPVVRTRLIQLRMLLTAIRRRSLK